MNRIERTECSRKGLRCTREDRLRDVDSFQRFHQSEHGFPALRDCFIRMSFRQAQPIERAQALDFNKCR